MNITLKIEKRDPSVRPDMLRKEGKIPAVLYGPKEPNLPVAIDAKAFEKVLRQAGETTIVDLEGEGEAKEALIHQVDHHPVTDTIEHVDFYVVEKGKKVTADIPFVFVGEAPAVKSLGGTLMKVMHEVEVEALPKDLPREITVDISSLVTFDSQISIKDIAVPSGVTVLAEPDEIIAAVAEPKEEVEEAPTTIDMESIEVEQKGKKEEEGTAEGEASGETKGE